MKKICLLPAMILFVFAVGGSVSADHLPDEQPNMLSDGDMELATIEPWRQWGQGGFVLEKLNGAMHLETAGTNGGFQQLNLPIEKHEAYFFSMDYRLLSGQLKTTFGNKNSNADFANRADILKQATPGEEYWHYERYIQIPADYKTDFRVVVTVRNGEGYFDNLTLKKVTDFDYFSGNRSFDDNSLIRDPWMDFEGTANWRNWATPNVLMKTWDPDPSDKWDQALYLDTLGVGAGVQQLNIPVEAGTRYRLRYSYYLLGGTLRPLLGIRSSNSDFEGVRTILNASGWSTSWRDFTVPDDFTGDFRLVFILRNGQGYIDDVTLEPIVDGLGTGTLYIQDEDRGDFVALPESENFPLGAQDINLGSFTFLARGENVLVNNLKFLVRRARGEQARFGRIKLYRGEQLIKTAAVQEFFDDDGNLSEDRLVEFNNLRLIFPPNEDVVLTLRTDSIPEDQGGVPASGYMILSPDFYNYSVTAIGLSSGAMLGGTHLVYGPYYGGNDRDFDLYGVNYVLGEEASLNLSFAPNPVLGETQNVRGEAGIRFLGVSATCNGVSDCRVRDITFTGDLDEDGNASNFIPGSDNGVSLNSLVGYVWLEDSSGVVIAGARAVQNSGIVNFSNINWDINSGATENFYLVGDFSSNAFANGNANNISFGINAVADFQYVDQDGNLLNAANTVNANNEVYVTALSGGSLSIEVDNGSPNENILVAGAANQLVSRFKFNASKEAFNVKKISINVKQIGVTDMDVGENDNNVGTVKISYINSAGAVENKFATPVHGTAQFSGMDFYIAKDGGAILDVMASVNTIIDGGGASTAGEFIDLNLAFNNFDAIAQFSGETYRVHKIDSDVDKDSDLDFGAIDFSGGNAALFDGDPAPSIVAPGETETFTVDDFEGDNTKELPVGTIICVDDDGNGICLAEDVWVVTSWFAASGTEDNVTLRLADDAGDGDYDDNDELLFALPGIGYLTGTKRMYVYNTLPALALGASTPGGPQVESLAGTILQLSITPAANDDVIIRQGMELDDENDPLETGMDDSEAVIVAGAGTNVVDGNGAIQWTGASVADEDCFLFDRSLNAGTDPGELGSYKYLSFWIKSSENDVSYDALQVVGDDDGTCIGGGDDQVFLTAANTWVNGVQLVDPDGGEGGGEVIGASGPDTWDLVTVEIQGSGLISSIDTVNNRYIGLSLESSATVPFANTDVLTIDGAVLHNEVLNVGLLGALDLTPDTVIDCTLKRGGLDLAAADVGVQTSAKGRLFIVPQDYESGTDYGDILITKGANNTYDLVCDTQAMMVVTPGPDLLTPFVNYGSSAEGVVTRGGFWWSADETVKTIVYWLGDVGVKLSGNTLSF